MHLRRLRRRALEPEALRAGGSAGREGRRADLGGGEAEYGLRLDLDGDLARGTLKAGAEPARGALGPADPAVWSEVREFIGRRAVVSAALGELLSERVLDLARQTAGLRFAKIGLAGCHSHCGWMDRWMAAVQSLPPRVEAVPVAYADWIKADAPSPSVALALAAQLPARLLLVDTFDKRSGNLLEAIAGETLRELIEYAQEARVHLALAGSLDAVAIEATLSYAPEYIGVRGAACAGGREGAIEIARVKSLAALVRRGPSVSVV